MERCRIGAFITNLGKFNEGEIVGEWISFPIKQEAFQEVLNKIGINENYVNYFNVIGFYVGNENKTETRVLQSIESKFLLDKIVWVEDEA